MDMISRRLALFLIGCVGCEYAPFTSAAVQRITDRESCRPVAEFGAIPDDGLPDNVALQAALDSGCLDLRGATGRFDIVVPPMPRRLWVLQAPDGIRIEGNDLAATLAISGDAGADDVWGIRLMGAALVYRAHFDGDGLTNTNEHAPLLFWVGPVDNVTIARSSFSYPPRAGMKRGDCIQGVGYAPDMLSTDITITRNHFESCGRAAFAYHSGTRGLTYTWNVHDNVSDGELDGEGRGNEPHLLLDGAEIAHNTFNLGASYEGGNSIQLIRARNVNVHHNTLNGRGVDLADVGGEFHHNVIRLDVNDEGLPNVLIRKGSNGLTLRNERYERVAPNGPVVMIENNGIAPHNISIEDSVLVQRASWHPVRIAGSHSVTLADVQIEHYGTTPMAGVLLEGIRAPVYDVSVLDSRMTGNLAASVNVSGAYLGAGAIEVMRSSSAAPLRCEDPGGITVPIAVSDNTMPAPAGCAVTED